MGEAHFLRAWAYFYAVRLWGDVPLILKSQTPTSTDFNPTRATTEEVYNVIVQDLKDAEAAGLNWTNTNGRVGLAAVKAQLAKVYLTMAGFPLNKGAAYYKLAADKAKEVFDYANAHTGEIALFTSYADLHSTAMNNKLEHLFQVQYLTGVEENPLQSIMLPNNSLPKNISAVGSGVGSSMPTLSFYNSYKKFEPKDKRTDEQQFFYTSYFENGSGAPFPLGAPYIFKHFDVEDHGKPGKDGTKHSNLNVPQIRYADVLLIYAEAQNRADGTANLDAYTALNAIRGRAASIRYPVLPRTPLKKQYGGNAYTNSATKALYGSICSVPGKYTMKTPMDSMNLLAMSIKTPARRSRKNISCTHCRSLK